MLRELRNVFEEEIKEYHGHRYAPDGEHPLVFAATSIMQMISGSFNRPASALEVELRKETVREVLTKAAKVVESWIDKKGWGDFMARALVDVYRVNLDKEDRLMAFLFFIG